MTISIKILIFISIAFKASGLLAAVAPILDVENESTGYIGTIGERNILVDLKPHLSIKNLDSINGICSYHVFKPNSEDFPFTIDIKDKMTGEAIIELVKRDSDELNPKSDKKILLDCNKRKVYDFLIQAHDCSTPSLASNKIPVKIEVIDHDDTPLKFDQTEYTPILAESHEPYENFMLVQAHDSDCTNSGHACAYKLLSKFGDELDVDTFAFGIDATSGSLSSRRALHATESFEFTVRAFDCVNKEAFVDARVKLNVVEKCQRQWLAYPAEISASLESSQPFDSLQAVSCEKVKYYAKPSAQCGQVEAVSSRVTLELDSSLKSLCQVEKCEESSVAAAKQPATAANSVITIYSSVDKQQLLPDKNLNKNVKNDSEDDDNIEDDDDEDNSDETQVFGAKATVAAPSSKVNRDLSLTGPTSFSSFSKSTENAQKIAFNGDEFGDRFVLSAWLRRPSNADQTIKEQVFCGTDSLAMNRHHFGLYFYRGNFKFLLRKEANTVPPSPPSNSNNNNNNNNNAVSAESTKVFYPSLWEWSLSEPKLNDAKWHFYEIRFNYPNASLYVDGVHFIENTTNSDIIDAYKLNDASETGEVVSYVGACYHARTNSLVDHFEGDIGSIVLRKVHKEEEEEDDDSAERQAKCKKNCNEFIETSMSPDDETIESASLYEISLKTSSLDDMTQALKRVNYVNKETHPISGLRSIKLTTTIQCSGHDQKETFKQVVVNVNVNRLKNQQYKVQLDGSKQLFVSKQDLENGVELFKDISILKLRDTSSDSAVAKREDSNDATEDSIDSQSAESDALPIDEQQQLKPSIKFSKCTINVQPDRNLMQPSANNEKIMLLQNLLDEFGFKFKQTLQQVIISGESSMENYEAFLRRLTYVVVHLSDINDEAKLKLIAYKRFYIKCVRSDLDVETNTILIKMNMTEEQDEKALVDAGKNPSYMALKQIDKYVVSETEDDVIQQKSGDFTRGSTADASNPFVIALIVMASCGVGFMLVFGAIRIYTSNIFSVNKKKPIGCEENPQMEWDDSGLNITENPLDALESVKVSHPRLQFEGDDYTTTEDECDGDEDAYIDDEEEEECEHCSHEEDVTSIKIAERGELEWDDTSLDVKLKQEKMNDNGNKSSFIDPNNFL